MWITVSIILRVESSLALCMLGNIFVLPSSSTKSLLECRILSLQIIFISTVTTFCLVSWHQFLLMTNQLPFQLLFLRVLSHYIWQLLRFFSLITIFISKFGLKFTFTFASWKFRFVFNLKMAKAWDITCWSTTSPPAFPFCFYGYQELQLCLLQFV